VSRNCQYHSTKIEMGNLHTMRHPRDQVLKTSPHSANHTTHLISMVVWKKLMTNFVTRLFNKSLLNQTWFITCCSVDFGTDSSGRYAWARPPTIYSVCSKSGSTDLISFGTFEPFENLPKFVPCQNQKNDPTFRIKLLIIFDN
jgi:hypothetical protein